MDKVKGTTSTGFNFSIDPEDVKDMRVVELMAKVKHDGSYIVEMANRILGEKQKDALYKYLEDKKGRVNSEKFGNALEEIMEAVNKAEQTKN